MADPFRLYVGARSPSIQDAIAIDGQAVDVSALPVTFSMRGRDSSTLKIDHAPASLALANGVVRYDWAAVDVNTVGEFIAWWEVTLAPGVVQVKDAGQVIVDPHGLPSSSSLCELDDVRAFLKKTAEDTKDDDVLAGLIPIASDVIGNYCSRQFTSGVGNPRSHRFRSSHRLLDLVPYDLRVADTVTLNPQSPNPTALTAWTDYELLPIDGDVSLGTYNVLKLHRHIRCHRHYIVDINGTWGAASIPPVVGQAAIVTVAEWFRAKVAGFSTRFNEDGVHVAPAPLPLAVCGWLEPLKRYPLV